MVLSTIKRLKYIYSSPTLDNFIFKLCYRWTALLLIVFSLIVTCRLLLGDSFVCLPQSNITLHYANQKCYADGIYINPADLIVWKYTSLRVDPSVKKLKRYQSYYSWVNLLFLIHAFKFYLPHLLWKSYESGYLRRLTAGVQMFFDKEERRDLELCYLTKYMLVTQGKHKFYTSIYIWAEIGNYLISLTQTVGLVYFFNVTGIPDSLPFKIKTWIDFKNFYFPSTGTCEIYFPENDAMEYTLCEMPLNYLYMRMFLFLHAWYVGLTILCGFVLVYRIALLVPSFRAFVIMSNTSLAEKTVLKSLCHRMSYSDWFFLSRLQETMTDIDFAQMIDKIAIMSQGKGELQDVNKRLSFFEDGMKDLDSSIETNSV